VVAEAIEGLRTKAESVRVLGSYPVATRGIPGGTGASAG
jgi:prephenate dehydratase